jgi:hypothetical protein
MVLASTMPLMMDLVSRVRLSLAVISRDVTMDKRARLLALNAFEQKQANRLNSSLKTRNAAMGQPNPELIAVASGANDVARTPEQERAELVRWGLCGGICAHHDLKVSKQLLHRLIVSHCAYTRPLTSFARNGTSLTSFVLRQRQVLLYALHLHHG